MGFWFSNKKHDPINALIDIHQGKLVEAIKDELNVTYDNIIVSKSSKVRDFPRRKRIVAKIVIDVYDDPHRYETHIYDDDDDDKDDDERPSFSNHYDEEEKQYSFRNYYDEDQKREEEDIFKGLYNSYNDDDENDW